MELFLRGLVIIVTSLILLISLVCLVLNGTLFGIRKSSPLT